jgi:hypothetical protein
MSFSAREKAIAIVPKFTSLLSMFGSSFIIYKVLQKPRSQQNTYHRLMLGMSVCDLLSSACFFLTTWPIPKEENIYAASGNQATCIAQGFFSQFSLATAIYNASLSFFYVMKIRYSWSSKRIERRLEPALHAVALLIGVGTAIAGVALNLYNNDSWECWIAPKPQDCQESWRNNGNTTCERGDNASLYRWVFYYALLWCAIVVVTVDMFLVYRAVLTTEMATERYDATRARHRKHSKQVAVQGYWYCGAFYLTWLFPTITRLVQVIADETPYPLILVTALFVPIQGFFNFLVYMHPRYKQVRMQVKSSIEFVTGKVSNFSHRESVESENRPTSAHESDVDNRPTSVHESNVSNRPTSVDESDFDNAP